MENAKRVNESSEQPAMLTSLSIIIPAYNEESGIAAVLDRILETRIALAAYGISSPEVIVVDDGSHDRTAEIVSAYRGVHLVHHPQNRGYGAALKTGFCKASGDMLAFLDADGTYPPEYLPQLCHTVQTGADIAIGSRMAGAHTEMPFVRKLGNLIFARIVTLIGGQFVSDSASGMRVFRRGILDRLYPLPDGLNFTPVMSTRAIHEGMKMVEVAIPYKERLGRSKLSVVRDGARFLNSIVWTALSYNPVRILGLLGLLGVAIALAVVIVLVFLRISGVTNLGVWGIFGVFTGLLCGVIGISLFNLGAMFNYLVSLFHRQPVRRGVFGKPIFDPPLDKHFWWIGGLLVLAGLTIAIISLVLTLAGNETERLWLWLLGSAMLTLMGVQLVVSWVVMRVLEELSQREMKVESDLRGI